MPSIENGYDPLHELADRGTELVEAASAIHHAVAAADSAPDTAHAAPAVLGCLETALDEMVAISASLERMTHRAVKERGIDADAEWHERHARMRSGFSHLHRGLRDARDLAGAARTRTSRALAGAGVTRAATLG